MSTQQLPALLRVEAKFTTSSGVSLPRRELVSLKPDNSEQAGILACLFWNSEADGHWLLVDQSSPTLRPQAYLQQHKLSHLALKSTHLRALQAHVNRYWWAFLVKNLEVALDGHEGLCQLLAKQSEEDSLLQGAEELVLRMEFEEAMARLLETHGEKQVGLIFQDLLCFLLASAGYSQIQNNPIGVPDIVLCRPVELSSAHLTLHLKLTYEELDRLIKYCGDANDAALVALLSRARPATGPAKGGGAPA